MAKLKPKEKAYYAHFSAAASIATSAAQSLAALAERGSDRGAIAEQLAEFARQAEARYHSVLTALRASFITPFERTEIQSLSRELSRVVDHLEAAGSLVHLLAPGDLPGEFGEITAVLSRAAETTEEAVGKLKKLKGIKHHHESMRAMAAEAELHRRRLLVSVTDGGIDAFAAVKLHAICEELAAAVAAFVGVAEAVETVLITEG